MFPRIHGISCLPLPLLFHLLRPPQLPHDSIHAVRLAPAGELAYIPTCWARLLPPAPRGAAGAAVSLLAVRAALWKQGVAPDDLLVRT